MLAQTSGAISGCYFEVIKYFYALCSKTKSSKLFIDVNNLRTPMIDCDFTSFA